MLSHKERKEQAEKLTRRAIERFGELKGRKTRPPLNQLILSIFYHLTSVRRATRALRQLKRNFVDWNEVRVSHPAEVGNTLSSAQWAHIGAERVQWVLRELTDMYHRTDLDFLQELTPAQARSCLTGMPAVPRHLADEVLLLSLGVCVLPLSQATARVCFRFGMLENDRQTVKNQKALQKVFDERYYVPVHLFLCDRGERFCLPDSPDCDDCPLGQDCPTARRATARSRR
ncbi:MAG: hypothetical protein PVJ27_06115 [Candidatus Brocadiaceae bacterium]|jgi:endonuclease-3